MIKLNLFGIFLVFPTYCRFPAGKLFSVNPSGCSPLGAFEFGILRLSLNFYL